jgi:dTDP-4-dehydrorhamnose reductase
MDGKIMKYLVTGVNGQLGHDVMKELSGRGYEGTGTGRRPGSGEMPYVQLDITDKDAVMRTVTAVKPDAVIHCAAWTAVDLAEDEAEQAYAVNVTGTQNIAEACRAVDCKLTYISTDYVFDGQGNEPWKPDTKECMPINVYGRTKLEGEQVVSSTLEKYFIVRTSWVFGSNGNNFIRTMINVGKTHPQVRVVNDQIGTPPYRYERDRKIRLLSCDKRGRIYQLVRSVLRSLQAVWAWDKGDSGDHCGVWKKQSRPAL